MNLQRIPLEKICMFKISTMYKFWDKHSGPTLHYPAFKVVFLYFKKKMQPRHKLGSFVQKISIEKKSHGWERAWLSTFTTWGATRYLQIFGIFVAIFFPWVKWWQLKDFLFSPQSLGEMIQFDEHIFWTGLKPPEIEVVPLPKFFPGLPLKSERKPIGKDRLNQPQTTIFQVGELLNLQGHRTSTWFL